MNIFLVLAHPEPKSFNGALLREAHRILIKLGHSVQTSDLYSIGFNPVSNRHNFTTVKDPDFFKPQTEEVYASEVGGFAPDLETELQKIEWLRPDDLAIPALVVRIAGHPKRLGRPNICHGTNIR